VFLFSTTEKREEMVVGHIRTLMNGSRTSVPIFPKIAFEGRHYAWTNWQVVVEKRTVRSFGMIS